MVNIEFSEHVHRNSKGEVVVEAPGPEN
jgi:hypothetical protein